MNMLQRTALLLIAALGAPLVAVAEDDFDWHRGSGFEWQGDWRNGWRQRPAPGALVERVRRETAKYQDVGTATEAGYEAGPCVSGREGGAMGIHYANLALIGDGIVDPAYPEILIYEPQRDGGLRLVGVEYITFADSWPAGTAPTLAGHLLNYTGAPNRYGIPAHFEIHVWAWRENPNGTFADWNPNVTCKHQPLS